MPRQFDVVIERDAEGYYVWNRGTCCPRKGRLFLFSASKAAIGPGLLHKILRDCHLTIDQFTELL
jgi:hypothetical protein